MRATRGAHQSSNAENLFRFNYAHVLIIAWGPWPPGERAPVRRQTYSVRRRWRFWHDMCGVAAAAAAAFDTVTWFTLRRACDGYFFFFFWPPLGLPRVKGCDRPSARPEAAIFREVEKIWITEEYWYWLLVISLRIRTYTGVGGPTSTHKSPERMFGACRPEGSGRVTDGFR